MNIQRCRAGPNKEEGRGRIAAPASASRPPRSPSELAFAHTNGRADSNQRYVLSFGSKLARELGAGFQFCDGSSPIDGLGKELNLALEGEVQGNWHGSVSRHGRKAVPEGVWESHGSHHYLSFRPGRDGGGRLMALLSLLSSLGQPVSDIWDDSGPADGGPDTGFGRVRVESGGRGSPSLTGGAVVEEANALEFAMS